MFIIRVRPLFISMLLALVVSGCAANPPAQIRINMQETQLMPDSVALNFLTTENRFPGWSNSFSFTNRRRCELLETGVPFPDGRLAYRNLFLATFEAPVSQSRKYYWGRLERIGVAGGDYCIAFMGPLQSGDSPGPSPLVVKIVTALTALGIQY